MLDRQDSGGCLKGKASGSPDVWKDCPPMLAPLGTQLWWQLRPTKPSEWGLWEELVHLTPTHHVPYPSTSSFLVSASSEQCSET